MPDNRGADIALKAAGYTRCALGGWHAYPGEECYHATGGAGECENIPQDTALAHAAFAQGYQEGIQEGRAAERASIVSDAQRAAVSYHLDMTGEGAAAAKALSRFADAIQDSRETAGK